MDKWVVARLRNSTPVVYCTSQLNLPLVETPVHWQNVGNNMTIRNQSSKRYLTLTGMVLHYPLTYHSKIRNVFDFYRKAINNSGVWGLKINYLNWFDYLIEGYLKTWLLLAKRHTKNMKNPLKCHILAWNYGID